MGNLTLQDFPGLGKVVESITAFADKCLERRNKQPFNDVAILAEWARLVNEIHALAKANDMSYEEYLEFIDKLRLGGDRGLAPTQSITTTFLQPTPHRWPRGNGSSKESHEAKQEVGGSAKAAKQIVLAEGPTISDNGHAKSSGSQKEQPYAPIRRRAGANRIREARRRLRRFHN